MIKRILQFLMLVTVCISAQSQAVNYNAVATAYVTTTISQNVVFNDTMRAGGNFTFSVLAHNGGGRPNENDTANVRIQFYTAGGALVSQVNSTYNANLAITSWSQGNPAAQPDVPWSTLTISSSNCGGSCANVAYATISMYGVDASFWAGDYGPWYRAPTFQLNGGGNLAYNPEFGPYNNVTAQGWTASPGFGACQGAWGGSNPCIVNDQGVPGQSTVGLVANANGGGPSATGGTTSGTAGGYNSTMTTTNAGAGTGQAAPTTPTVTGTAVTYTTRNVVSGNTTTVYQTPVTTTTYSDNTTSSSNGTETLYQTRVASNVVTNKIVNGVLTTTTTPVAKVTTSGVTTIEANGTATTTSQNVLQGLNYKVYDYDAYTYTCVLGICGKNLLGPYVVPNMAPNAYTQVASGRTSNGIYVPTNGSFPGMGTGTLVSYTGTITAPTTAARTAGTVYRLYFYSNSDDGFVMKVNGQTIINDRSTNQLQNIIGGYTSSGWIDVVAGQTYNIEAWYWNNVGAYGMRLQWDYGAGRMAVPNSAFTTGWITETNTIDTTGAVYGNTSLIDMSGTAVSMYPSYVTIGLGTAGETIFGTASEIISGQQTKIDTWTNKTITGGNSIYIDQVSGSGNTVTMEQDGNKNKIDATLDGSTNTITVKQGTPGIGQNEIKLGVTGSYNALDISQARNDQGLVTGTNGQYHDVVVNGSNNTLTTRQSNTGGVGGHYMETTINGNQNNVTKKQTDNGNKIMFTTVSGNNNTVDAVQKGTGQHYLDTAITGNSNSLSAVQEGNITNRATIDMTNAGGPASVILNQTGGQNVTVTTTCVTSGGCAPITVRQGY